jgi:hypothetical protein
MSPHKPTAERQHTTLQGHPQTMNAKSIFRKPGLFLVEIGDTFALVDPAGERLVLLNAAGAWLWSRLGPDCEPPAEFAAELRRLDLLGPTAPGDDVEPMGAPDGTPRVLGVAPLQVAANNSTDPFSGTGW